MAGADWLVALDIDGTILHVDGAVSDVVGAEVRRVEALGHHVMLATGRSVDTTLPVLDKLGITPEYVVCSNGAITLRRDADAPVGYRREHVETFDPGPVLDRIRTHLTEALFAVEDAEGNFSCTETFPDSVLGRSYHVVPFASLAEVVATRVVVISPGHDMEDFLDVVERMGLHKVSYSIGWTAWLDIAPDGVNKATGLERVRERLDVPRSQVCVIGDGRNDIEMFEWAAAGGGRAVVMAQAPEDVLAVGTEVTASIDDDGVAAALASF